MNSLKQMFKSKVAVPLLALGMFFSLGKASGQTKAPVDSKTSPMSDTRSTFGVNANAVVADDKDPEVASLTVIDVEKEFEGRYHYSQMLDDAREASRDGNVLSIVLSRGQGAKFTNEQIIDALDNKIFTGKRDVNLRIYKIDIPDYKGFYFDVISHGKRMFENSHLNENGHEDGHYAYSQIKSNPSFFIAGHKKSSLSLENTIGY